MRRAMKGRVAMSYTLREERWMLVWFASVLFAVTAAGCGAFAAATPTVSPDRLKIDAVETRIQDACDDFIRQQAALTAEGVYDFGGREIISTDEIPDAVLARHVERAYTDALAVFDGLDSDSTHADAVRAMIARIAPMQRHADKWEDAFWATFQDLVTEEFPDAEVTPMPVHLTMTLSEWRNRFVELCADW